MPDGPNSVQFSSEHVEALQKIIQLYVDGNTSRMDAIFELHQQGRTICTAISTPFSSQILQPYMDQLDVHSESQRVGSGAGGAGGSSERPGGSGDLDDPDGNGDGPFPQGHKRPRDDADDEPVAPKRAKFDPAAVAWGGEADRFLDSVAFSPQHLAVVKQIEVYSLDIKEALRMLSLALRKPVFPDSLWKDVLLDRFVDLDTVLASRFAVEPDEPQQLVVGDHQLEIKKPKMVSRVSSHGQWLLAFRAYAKAVTFAFNGRQDELETYENHIHELFASWNPSLHHRVLSYDRAARNLIGQSHGILFSDIHKLRACENAHLSAGGVCVSAGSSSGQAEHKPKGKKTKRPDGGEVCRNFNYNKCDRGTDCKFRHACLRCKSDGHILGDCPDKQRH